MEFSISTLNTIAQSSSFGCILLMIGIVFLYRWANKAWLAVTELTKSSNDTLIKTTVVMEKVLDKLSEK